MKLNFNEIYILSIASTDDINLPEIHFKIQ